MTRPSPSAGEPDAIARLGTELGALRASIDAMGSRLDRRLLELAQVQARLEQSEAARRDLMAQAEHLVELLAEARRELRWRHEQRGTQTG